MKKLLWLLLLAVLLTGCAGDADPQSVPSSDSHIVQNQDEYALKTGMIKEDTANPVLTAHKVNRDIYGLIFDPLFRITAGMEPQGILAQKYEVIDDGRGLVITLDSQAKWQDGTAVTAADVAYTFDVIQNTNYDSPYRTRLDNVRAVSMLGGSMIEIGLNYADSGFVNNLDFPVIPSGSVPADNHLQFSAVGNGMYKIIDNSRGIMRLQRDMNYWRGAIEEIDMVERIVVRIMPDNETIYNAFSMNTADVMQINVADISKYISSEKTSFAVMPTDNYCFMGINLNAALLNDAGLREVLYQAVDRNTIAKNIMNNFATSADMPVNPYSAYSLKEQSVKEKADIKTQLDQLGYEKIGPGGIREAGDYQMSFTLLINEENHIRETIASQIAKDFLAYGIEIQIVAVDFETYESRLNFSNFELFLATVNTNASGDLDFLLGSGKSMNYTGYHNADMDAALAGINNATDSVSRRDSFIKMQQTFLQDYPHIPIYFENELILYKNEAVAMGQLGMPFNMYRNIEGWRLVKK